MAPLMFSAVIPWYLNLLLLGWLAWPLVFRVAGRLHDRGYVLARALGLILTTYLTWLLGNLPLARGASPLLPFSYGSVILAAAMVGAVSLTSFISERGELTRFVRRSGKTLLAYEILFLLAFAALVALRAQIPHISYHAADPLVDPIQDYAAEKFTDFAILNGLLASPSFPPHDPWLSGATMNYYYFGHLMWACLVKLTGIRPEIAFNLALASALALVITLGASLGYNLTRRRRWGALAAFLIALAGNLDGFLQLFGALRQVVSNAAAEGLPRASFPQSLFGAYDFWRSSRAVENTITEFPAFSFVLGDLHAHVSGLVIFLSGLLLLVQVWRSASRAPSLLRYEIHCWEELFLAALLIGAMSAANSWDALTYAVVMALVLWAARLRRRPRTLSATVVLPRLLAGFEVALLTAVVVLVGVKAFFAPYGRSFDAPLPPFLAAVEVPGLRITHFPPGLNEEQTELVAERAGRLIAVGLGSAQAQFLHDARWEVDLFPPGPEFSLKVISSPIKWLRPASRTSFVEFAAHWALLLAAPVVLGTSLLRRAWRRAGSPAPAKPARPAGADARQRFWALLATGVAVAAVLFPVLQGWVASAGVVVAAALFAILAVTWFPPALRLFIALLLAFTILAVFCELFFVDDIFDVPIERINTVFKIYYGMWQLGALLAVLAAHRLIRYAPPFRRKRRARLIVATLLLVGGTYTVMAPVQRIMATTRLGRPEAAFEGVRKELLPPYLRPEAAPDSLQERLDGLRYLAWVHPDDYLALRWMRDRRNVAPEARILEAAGGQYEYAGRFGTVTGRPAFAGWLMHEYGWRGPRFTAERERRTTTTAEIYNTRNPFKALSLLAADRIEYVVVGELERRKYPLLVPGTLPDTKFRAIAAPVFESGDTTIYKVNLPGRSALEVAALKAMAAEEEETTAPEDAPLPSTGITPPVSGLPLSSGTSTGAVEEAAHLPSPAPVETSPTMSLLEALERRAPFTTGTVEEP